MAQVWANSKCKGSARLLLLAIADHARDEGDGAFPSVDTLKRKVLMSERHVHRLIGILERMGEIEVQRGQGPGGVNMYTVCPGGAKMSPGGVTPASVRGDTRGTRGVTPAAPRTISNHPQPSAGFLVPTGKAAEEMRSKAVDDARKWLASRPKLS